MFKTTFFACFLAALGAAQPFPQKCPSGTTPHFPSPTSTAIDSCGLPGSALGNTAEGKAEGLQNSAKNNFCAEGAAQPLDAAKAKSLQASVETEETKRKLKPGKPPADRSFLQSLGESHVVVFEGFVFEARQECAESVNCGDVPANADASHDIHISLLDGQRTTKKADAKAKQDAEECTGFVAEMIPHHRPGEWSACNVNDVADKGLRVRITGQQFFDGSHLPCKNGKPDGNNPKRVSGKSIRSTRSRCVPLAIAKVVDGSRSKSSPRERLRAKTSHVKQKSQNSRSSAPARALPAYHSRGGLTCHVLDSCSAVYC